MSSITIAPVTPVTTVPAITTAERSDFLKKLSALKDDQCLERTNMGYQIVKKDDANKLSLDRICDIAKACLDNITATYKQDQIANEKNYKTAGYLDKTFIEQTYFEQAKELHNALAGYVVRYYDDVVNYREFPDEFGFLRVGGFLTFLQFKLYRQLITETDVKAATEAPKGPAPSIASPPQQAEKDEKANAAATEKPASSPSKTTKSVLTPIKFSYKNLNNLDHRQKITNTLNNHFKCAVAYGCKVGQIYKCSYWEMLPITNKYKMLSHEHQDEIDLCRADLDAFLSSSKITKASQAIFGRLPTETWLSDMIDETIIAEVAQKDILAIATQWTEHKESYFQARTALRQFYGKIIDFSHTFKAIPELEGSSAAIALRSLFLDLEAFKETQPERNHLAINNSVQQFLSAAGYDLNFEILNDKEKLEQEHKELMNQCDALPIHALDCESPKYVLVPIGFLAPGGGHTAFVIIERYTFLSYCVTIINTGGGCPRSENGYTSATNYIFLSLEQISACFRDLYKFLLPSKDHSMELVNATIEGHLRKTFGYNKFYGGKILKQSKGTCCYQAALRVLFCRLPAVVYRQFLLFMIKRTVAQTEKCLDSLGERRTEMLQAILHKEVADEAETIVEKLFNEAEVVETLYKQAIRDVTHEEAFPATSTWSQSHINKTLQLFETRF